MKLLWSEQSFVRLAEIEDYIAWDNPRAARRNTERLIARTESRRDHLRLGRTLPEFHTDSLRKILVWLRSFLAWILVSRQSPVGTGYNLAPTGR